MLTSLIGEIRKLHGNFCPINIPNYYATITIDEDSIDFENHTFCLCGEIFTDSILEHDALLFEQLQEHNNIQTEQFALFFYGYNSKPIRFYEFVKYFKSFIHLKFPCPYKKELPKKQYTFECQLYNEINSNDVTDNITCCMECFIQMWNDTFKHQLFNLKFCFNAKIKANIYFCASPFETHQRYIKFTPCNKTLPTLSNTIISKLTNKTPIPSLDFKPKKITTYYVGQGNFSKITCKGEKEIIFDIGLTTHERHNNFGNSIAEIKKVRPKYIIISHLDIDHFLGVQYLDSDVFDSANWIISIHGNLTQSALRLIAYIASKNQNNLYLYDNCGQQLITGIFSLYQGTGQKILTCNSKNNGGLILKIEYNDKTALLPGDCIYDAMPCCLEGAYNFLLVPHHCCKILQNSNIRNFLPVYNGEQAIISYGENSYGHPNQDHMNQLIIQNFTIVSTHKNGNPIVFNFQ